MVVSDRDRAFMRKLGQLKAESHSQAAREHLAATIRERLRRSWSLAATHSGRSRAIHDDDPTALYERARKLGLYRP